MTSIISLQNVQFSYDGAANAVLRDFSLNVATGATTAILGPNGSGKSTLLYLLLGMFTPQRGTITLDGKPHAEYTRRERSRLIGLVPQAEHFPLGFSVLQYVLLGRSPHLGLLQRPGKDDRAAARTALETGGITALAPRQVVSLSGGEQQLATIARSLAQGPRIMLMDEPTSHLDLGNKSRVMELIRRMSAAGVTVIITTHDPNIAAAVAQDVVLMKRGQIVAAGQTDAVINAENLTATYDLPIEVARVRERLVILTP